MSPPTHVVDLQRKATPKKLVIRRTEEAGWPCFVAAASVLGQLSAAPTQTAHVYHRQGWPAQRPKTRQRSDLIRQSPCGMRRNMGGASLGQCLRQERQRGCQRCLASDSGASPERPGRSTEKVVLTQGLSASPFPTTAGRRWDSGTLGRWDAGTLSDVRHAGRIARCKRYRKRPSQGVLKA